MNCKIDMVYIGRAQATCGCHEIMEDSISGGLVEMCGAQYEIQKFCKTEHKSYLAEPRYK